MSVVVWTPVEKAAVVERAWCQAGVSSATYHCMTLGNLSLSFLLCEMDLIKYLRLGVGVKVDKEK